jgi:hypothetical protein
VHPNGNSSGKSYIVFGKANNSAINLSDIANASDPTGGFVINGEVVDDRSGFSISSAGDVNGDGQWLIIQWHWCYLVYQIQHTIYLHLNYH